METTSYDTLGRVIGHYSPDMGTTTNMVYDGFNELLSSKHQETGATTQSFYEVATGRSTGWSTSDSSSGTTVSAGT